MKDRSAWIHHNVLGDDSPYTQLSWLGKLSRTFYCSARRYGSDHQSQRAVALTYYTLFAVVPVMALVFGIAKGFSLEDKLQVFLEEKFANHQDVLNWIYQFADTTLKEAQGGVVAGVGVIALIWTVIWLASNIERAFNAVWNLPTRKNMFRRFSDYLAIILVTPIILVVMSSAGVFMRSMMGHILAGMPWLGGAGFILFSIMIKLFPLLLVILLFTLIYFLVPNTKVRFGSALLSGIVAGMLYQLLQDGFIYVQSALYRYNTIYGSFAALPLFLIWLQWSWQIALFGAEIGYVHQNASSGLFDRMDTGPLSLRLRREYQLALARIVYRNFDDGKGPTAFSELCAALPIPMIRLQPLARELVEAGVFERVENSGSVALFMPGRPTERQTVCDLFDQLDRNGATVPEHLAARALSNIGPQLDRIRESAAASPGNLKIREL